MSSASCVARYPFLVSLCLTPPLCWTDICLKETMSLADSLYNLQLVQEFCRNNLNHCCHFTLEDLLYAHASIKVGLTVCRQFCFHGERRWRNGETFLEGEEQEWEITHGQKWVTQGKVWMWVGLALTGIAIVCMFLCACLCMYMLERDRLQQTVCAGAFRVQCLYFWETPFTPSHSLLQQRTDSHLCPPLLFFSLHVSLVLVKKQTNKKDFYRHRAPPFMLIWLWLGDLL